MNELEEFHRRQDAMQVGALVQRACVALARSHGQLAPMLGVSRRSVSRWTCTGTTLNRDQILTLVRAVRPHDRALAVEIAGAARETLASLGLEAAPPAQKGVSRDVVRAKLVDAVVCAAAEALDASPRAVRPALLAALRAAREASLTMDDLESLLASPPTSSAKEARGARAPGERR